MKSIEFRFVSGSDGNRYSADYIGIPEEKPYERSPYCLYICHRILLAHGLCQVSKLDATDVRMESLLLLQNAFRYVSVRSTSLGRRCRQKVFPAQRADRSDHCCQSCRYSVYREE